MKTTKIFLLTLIHILLTKAHDPGETAPFAHDIG